MVIYYAAINIYYRHLNKVIFRELTVPKFQVIWTQNSNPGVCLMPPTLNYHQAVIKHMLEVTIKG